MNAGDVMVTWFASYANLVMSRWACTSRMRMHGTCAIIKMGASKYLNSLTGTPADSNLGKLTTLHFKALTPKMQTRTCQTCSHKCIPMRT